MKKRTEDMLHLERMALSLGPEAPARQMLGQARMSFEHSKNPYYAWYAIDVCIKNKMQLPDWLMPYLAQCSERMLSGTARQTGDLRKLLPWVLGFSPKKPGPGRLLHPDRTQQKTQFAIEFAVRIIGGDDPVTARSKASEEVFDEVVEDKMLLRWLREEFNLKKAPLTTEQWKNTLWPQGRQAGVREVGPVLRQLFQREMDQLFRQLHFVRTKSRETQP